MRTLVVLLCSLALVSPALGAQKERKKSEQKKPAQTSQHAVQPANRPATGARSNKPATAARQRQNSAGTYQAQTRNKPQTPRVASQGQKGKKNETATQAGKATRGGQVNRPGKPDERATATTAGQTAKGKTAQAKPLKPQHFDVPKQPNTAKAPPVQFQQGRRIVGAERWQGQKYTVFRNYRAVWHDQGWWRSHYGNHIVFVFGAPYYWSAGYWFPAWGYYPNAYYAWDGPIYAYNHLPPDQVIANVQAALQQQGYYHGDVDGLIGPLTRAAIADYQRDNGLYETAAIDEPTLQSLGMA
jgi:hypothetical protein